MKNSTTTYLITMMLVLFFKLSYGEATGVPEPDAPEPCTPTQQTILFDSIRIDGQSAPFQIKAQNPYEIEVFLNGANFAGPYYTRAWIDVNENNVFEASELVMDHGPDSTLAFLEVVNLPVLTPGKDYKIRFAISNTPNFAPCDPVIDDFFDSTLRMDNPFLIKADDSLCPCAYNPQNDLGPFCVYLGDPISGMILYEVPKTQIPKHTVRLRVTVTVRDPFNRWIDIHASLETKEFVFVRAIDPDAIDTETFLFPFELQNINPPGTPQTDRYSIYIKLEAQIYEEEENNDDSGIMNRRKRQEVPYDFIVTREAYIKLCDEQLERTSDSLSWSPYPNPASDRLYIYEEESTPRNYLLYDSSGNLVKEGNTKESFINMSTRKKGLYLLLIGQDRHLISKQ